MDSNRYRHTQQFCCETISSFHPLWLLLLLLFSLSLLLLLHCIFSLYTILALDDFKWWNAIYCLSFTFSQVRASADNVTNAFIFDCCCCWMVGCCNQLLLNKNQLEWHHLADICCCSYCHFFFIFCFANQSRDTIPLGETENQTAKSPSNGLFG